MTIKKRGRPQKTAKALSHAEIIATAKTLMVKNGKIPSIRALSAELNVDAMAIYYYFKNKTVLLEELTASLITEIYQPKDGLAWEVQLRELSKSYLTLLSKYNGLLHTLLAMDATSPANVFIDRFTHITHGLNMSAAHSHAALNLLVDYLHGFSMAMSCNNADQLVVDDIDASLDIIFTGIKASL